MSEKKMKKSHGITFLFYKPASGVVNFTTKHPQALLKEEKQAKLDNKLKGI